MTKRYTVPEEGLKWVIRARYGTANQEQTEAISRVLEAFIRWQSEELAKSEGMSWMLNGTYQEGFVAAWKKITHMYDSHAPEPEVDRIDYYYRTGGGEYVLIGSAAPGQPFIHNAPPEPSVPEEIKGLLWKGKTNHFQLDNINSAHDWLVNEAFRRGKESK